MSGAVVLGDFRIIGGSLRGIIDEQGNRSSRCFSIENAGEDLNLVSFLSLSDIFAGAGLSAVEIRLDIRLASGKTCRTAIYDSADRLAMGFSPCGNAENGAKNRTGHETHSFR